MIGSMPVRGPQPAEPVPIGSGFHRLTVLGLLVLAATLALLPACSGATASPDGTSDTGSSPPPTGEWTTSLETQNGNTLMTVDIGRVDRRWVGEFDLEGFRVQDYPVQVEVRNSRVTLRFSSIQLDFAGTLSADGGRLIGTFGDPDTVVFERVGDPQFSELFLELEAAAEDSTAVAPLAPDARELREAFNRDTAEVRLLMLLSPTCPMCRAGANAVRHHVLEGIKDANLRVYAVWEPILRADDVRAARRSTALLDDARVTNYWVATHDVGVMFEAPLDLENEPAWDVYLLYPRGARWDGTPPAPAFFMHQMRGRLPDERLLAGDRLAAEIRHMLAGED